MISDTFTFEDLVQLLKNNKPFDFSRFGDGEMNCIFRDRKQTKNCDNHVYFDDLGERLFSILAESPRYFIGLQSLAYKQRTKGIDTLTNKYGLKWVKSDILHYANIKGYIKEFFEVLKTRKVILVAPMHLKNLDLFDFEFIKVPTVNCWLSYEMTKRQIAEKITPDSVILYCSSMMSNVLIDDFKGQTTQIDCGSIFEPYVGMSIRSYHKKLLGSL